MPIVLWSQRSEVTLHNSLQHPDDAQMCLGIKYSQNSYSERSFCIHFRQLYQRISLPHLTRISQTASTLAFPSPSVCFNPQSGGCHDLTTQPLYWYDSKDCKVLSPKCNCQHTFCHYRMQGEKNWSPLSTVVCHKPIIY